jgi:hypothetical protein
VKVLFSAGASFSAPSKSVGTSTAGRGIVNREFDRHGLPWCRVCPGRNIFADAEDVDASAGHERAREGEFLDGRPHWDPDLAAEGFGNTEGYLQMVPSAAGAAADKLGLEFEWICLRLGHIALTFDWGGQEEILL